MARFQPQPEGPGHFFAQLRYQSLICNNQITLLLPCWTKKWAQAEVIKLVLTGPSKVANEASDNAERLKSLENKFNQLSILTEAMWEMLLEKNQYDNDTLKEKIEQIVQGREHRRGAKLSCVKCGMENVAAKPVCIYCGGELDGEAIESPFDGL